MKTLLAILILTILAGYLSRFSFIKSADSGFLQQTEKTGEKTAEENTDTEDILNDDSPAIEYAAKMADHYYYSWSMLFPVLDNTAPPPEREL